MLLVLDQPIQEAGGMITLTDAFVRVNRFIFMGFIFS